MSDPKSAPLFRAQGPAFAVALLAAVVLGVLAARAIAGSILSPVQHARQAAEAIGHGDLRHHIQVQGQDEVAHMLRAMQAVGLVWDIREVPAHVREGKNKLA